MCTVIKYDVSTFSDIRFNDSITVLLYYKLYTRESVDSILVLFIKIHANQVLPNNGFLSVGKQDIDASIARLWFGWGHP